MISKYEKTNGVRLFALVAVLAMVFAGAAVMMDDGVDAAPNDGTTYLSGQITATQNFGNDTNVVVNGELTIPAGMALIITGSGKLTVEAGASIEIAAGGQLILQETADKKPTVTINGSIVAKGTATAEGYTGAPYYGAIVNNVAQDADGKTGVFVSGSITLERGAELISTDSVDTAGTTELPKDVTITDADGAIILNNGATLDVTQRSRSVSVIGGQDIYLNAGATLSINGDVLGTVNVKAVGSGTYYTAGAATIADIAEHNNEKASASDLTFTVSVQNTQALTNPADDKSNVTLRQYILNIEGSVDNNEKLSITGGVSKSVIDKEVKDDVFYQTSGYKYTIFPLVTVTGTLEVGASSDFALAINNQLNVTGTLNFAYNADLKDYKAEAEGEQQDVTGKNVRGTATINGTMYVTGTVTGSYYADGDESSAYASLVIDQTSNKDDNSNRMVVDGGSIQLTATNNIDLQKGFLEPNVKARFYGSVYSTNGTGNNAVSTIYIVDFDVAVAGAVAAESDEVYTFAFGAQNATTSDKAAERGAFVIEENITIPDGLTVIVWNALVVSENAVLTIEEGATVEIAQGVRETSQTPGVLWVEGKVVDYDGCMDTYRGTEFGDADKKGIFKYQVMKTTETDTEYYVTYTTLDIAISEAQPGEEIQLNGSVIIDSDLTIPADVTVITDSEAAAPALTVKGATLTVNGILEISGTTANAVKLDQNDAGTRDGAIVVNNLIKNADEKTFVDKADAVKPISGAYFNAIIDEDDVSGTDYVGSVAVASTNSTEVTTGDIVIYGTVSMGDVTFTVGENNQTMKVVIGKDAKVTAGTVTLVGVGFDIKTNTGLTFTGTVSSDVTAGTAAVAFSNASGMTISFDSQDDGETVTTTMILDGTLKGTATIQSGTVDAGTALKVGTYTPANTGEKTAEDKAVLTVASGATLNVASKGNLAVVEPTGATGADKLFSGLVVDGTLVVGKDGVFAVDDAAQIDIAGTAAFNNVTVGGIQGTVYVTGTFAASTEEGAEGKVTISKMYVGDADGAAGTVTGAINLNTNGGFIVAYTTADITGAAIDETDGVSNAVVTQYYINGEVYMTSYANATADIGNIIPEKIEMTGYEDVVLGTNKDNTSWYTDEAMTNALYKTEGGVGAITNYTAVYAKADLLSAAVRLSIGPGMSVYIDDVRYTSGVLELAVGEHSIVIQVNPGYAGTTSVTLGGTAITGGTFTITPEIAEEYQYVNENSDAITLSVMGDIAYDTGSTDDSGMGLTEILLIILVVLIVVMAIMVALRLMRS